MVTIPQASVLGPVLFNVFIDDLEETGRPLISSVDVKVGGLTDMWKARAVIQRSYTG